MFNLVLYQPEIPSNTGNIIRLAANTGANLHLIRPLGFIWEDKKLKRAGLDYHQWSTVTLHNNWESYVTLFPDSKIWYIETSGTERYCDAHFHPGDTLVFGSETTGIPEHLLQTPNTVLRLPQCPPGRSLNLSNAVSIVLYEAWRQNNFKIL